MFIVGPPRSGTTLVYQALVHSMQWSYFCSLSEERESWPVLATLMARKGIDNYQSSFSSQHGFTEPNAGPAEARNIWANWLGWLQSDEAPAAGQLASMQQTVNAISNILGAPFLSKSPDHCLHLKHLTSAFPDALYLRIQRDRVDTARSILHARLKLGAHWFGVKPPGWEASLELPVVEQVFYQVDKLNRLLDEGFANLVAPEKTLLLDYDSFCRDPGGEINHIKDFLISQGVVVNTRHQAPVSFEQSSGQTFNLDMENDFLGFAGQGI